MDFECISDVFGVADCTGGVGMSIEYEYRYNSNHPHGVMLIPHSLHNTTIIEPLLSPTREGEEWDVG